MHIHSPVGGKDLPKSSTWMDVSEPRVNISRHYTRTSIFKQSYTRLRFVDVPFKLHGLRTYLPNLPACL